MAKSKSLISLANIPVEDIYTYLTVVKGIQPKDANAVDTDKVAGIDADTIAIAIGPEDRETVKNALMLGDIPAEEYLTMKGSDALLQDTYAVSTTLSNELKEMRDELYQLKAELAKQGYIKQNHVYDGFYDAFRKDDIRYISEEIGTVSNAENAVSDRISLVENVDIQPGEFVAIKTADGRMHAYRVEDKTNNRLNLDRPLGFDLPIGAGVYKYAGVYYNGEFVFGKDSGSYTSPEIVKAIVKDGKNRTVVKTIGEGAKGYATKLSNYYSTYGSYVRYVEFSLAYSGNPGSIKASIWKVVSEDSKDRPVCERIAESNSVYTSSCTNSLSDVRFSFEQPVKIEAGCVYILGLYCGGASETNTWKVGGYVDEYEVSSGSQWFTDDTYNFNGEVFDMIPGSSDAYMALGMSKQVEAEVIYSNCGLYSCQEEIKGGFTRARVELRVNREGHFTVSSQSSEVTKANNTIYLAGGESVGPFYSKNGDIAVVGSMFSKVSGDCTATVLQVEDDLYTPIDADVYRVGYTVVAKCKKKVSDVPLAYAEPVLVELPLVAVMKGKEPGKEATSSDRLIFEAEIKQGEKVALEMFDHIEIQVFWKSGLQSESITSNPQFAGKILDISVATDKSYNKVSE